MAFFPYPMFDPMGFVGRSMRQMQHNMGYMEMPHYMGYMEMPHNMGYMEMPWENQARAHARYYRPWRHIPEQQSETSNVTLDKERFQIELDVQRYAPGEISVNTTDNHIVVEGKHEEKEDEHGFVSRHFSRSYTIPKCVHAESINSTLSTDGLLTVSASTVSDVQGKNEHIIPIATTEVRANK